MRLPLSPGPAWATFTEPDTSSAVPSEDELHLEDSQPNWELMAEPTRKRKASTLGSLSHRKPPKEPRLNQGEAQSNANNLANASDASTDFCGLPFIPSGMKASTQNANAGPSKARASRVDLISKHASTQPASRLDISSRRPPTSSTQQIAIPEALSRPSLTQAISSAKTRIKRKKREQTYSGHPSSSPDLPESISASLRSNKGKVSAKTRTSVNGSVTESKQRAHRSTKGFKSDPKVQSSSTNPKNKDISRRKTFPSIPARGDDVIDLLSSDDEPSAAKAHPSKNNLVKPATVPSGIIDLTLDTDNESPATPIRGSVTGAKSASPIHKHVSSASGLDRLPTTPSCRVRDDGVISLSDEELLQPPIVYPSPLVLQSRYSTPSFIPPNDLVHYEMIGNQDAVLSNIPPVILNPAGQDEFEPDLDRGALFHVDMKHPESEVEPKGPQPVDTFSSPMENDKDVGPPDIPTEHAVALDSIVFIDNSQVQLTPEFAPHSPSSPVNGEEVTTVFSIGSVKIGVVGHDAERASEIATLHTLPNFIVMPNPPPSVDVHKPVTIDMDVITATNEQSLSRSNDTHIAKSQIDELATKHDLLHSETITPPPRPSPVVVNGPFTYTDRAFAWMGRRVQHQSISYESAICGNPTPPSVVKNPSSSGANMEPINIESGVQTPSNTLHDVVVKSPLPSLKVETMPQSQPQLFTRRPSTPSPKGQSLKDVINKVREQYEENIMQAKVTACLSRSTSLATDVVDLTLSDNDNDDIPQAISNAEHFMSLFDRAVASREQGRAPAKVSRQNEPPPASFPIQNVALVVRSSSNSRESSVWGMKKLPSLDEIRSIRQLGKTLDDRTKALRSPMPRKQLSGSWASPATNSSVPQNGDGESPEIACVLTSNENSNVPSDRLCASTPPSPSPMISAVTSATMVRGVEKMGGLSSPIPVGHQSAESFEKNSRQGGLNPLADSRASDATLSMDVDVNPATSNLQLLSDLSYRSPKSIPSSPSPPIAKHLAPPAIDSVVSKPQPLADTEIRSRPQNAILCPAPSDDDENMAVDTFVPVVPPLTPQPVLSEDSDDGEWSVNLIYPDDTEFLADNCELPTDNQNVLSTANVAESQVLNEAHLLPYGPARGLSSGTTSHRSCRRSPGSSPDPLDILDKGTENPVKTPIINEPHGSNKSPGGFTSDVQGTSSNDFPVITWADIREAARKTKPKYFLAKDLPHDLQDYINAMDPSYRAMSMNRAIFEANIIENTMDDEPDAPPIRIINEIDDEPTPLWEFHYTNQMWHGEGVPPPNITDLLSCDCEGGSCDPKSKTCACLQRQQKYTSECTPDFAYDQRGRLKLDEIPIFECNDLCGCGEECRNRVVQHGRKWAVNIAKTREKGWGVFAGSRRIPRGSFIGIYAGELLTEAVGEERGIKYNEFGRTYLFDIDFHILKQDNQDWKNLYVVDAYHAGNFTRYLNHSCDPNCSLNACYINEANIDKPLLSVFTRRDVEPGEELCFSYSGLPHDDSDDEGDRNDDRASSMDANAAIFVPCRCGTSRCTGVMFK